jgi:hypothetical protein
MSQRNIIRARRMWVCGVSIGRIAKCLNCTVVSVAFQLARGDLA